MILEYVTVVAQFAINFGHTLPLFLVTTFQDYPANTLHLRIQLMLRREDRCTDFQFYVEHFDYMRL